MSGQHWQSIHLHDEVRKRAGHSLEGDFFFRSHLTLENGSGDVTEKALDDGYCEDVDA